MPYYANVEDASRNWTERDHAVVDSSWLGSCWITYGACIHVVSLALSIIATVFHFSLKTDDSLLSRLQGGLYTVSILLYLLAMCVSAGNYRRPAGCCLLMNFRFNVLITIFSFVLCCAAARVLKEYYDNYDDNKDCRMYNMYNIKIDNGEECRLLVLQRNAAYCGLSAAVVDILASLPNMFCASSALKSRKRYDSTHPNHGVPSIIHSTHDEANRPFQAIWTQRSGTTVGDDGILEDYSREISRYASPSRSPNQRHSNVYSENQEEYDNVFDTDYSQELRDDISQVSIGAPPPPYEEVIPCPPPTYDDAITALNNTLTTSV